MNNIKLKIIEPNDLDIVSEIHKKAFPDSVLTILGNDVIRRYYEWQMGPPNDCYAIGYYEERIMIGFCFAGIFRDSERGFFRKNWRALFSHFLLHPGLLRKDILRERIKYFIQAFIVQDTLSKKNKVSSDNPKIDKFGILSIAVDPKYHKMGVGKSLIMEVETFARLKHFSLMRLSVHLENYKAIYFYEHQGWVRKLDETGKWFGLMEKLL